MGVLDTQTIRRRKGNRYLRRDRSAPDHRTTGRTRAPEPAPRARREQVQYRVRAPEGPSRWATGAEAVVAAAVYAAQVLGRWAWLATRTLVWLGGRGLAGLARASVAGLRAALRALAWFAALGWRAGIAAARGMGLAAQRAQPHVERGARASVELGWEGARASARLGRRAATYSAAQLRTQAEDMRDGFPDLQQGASLARRQARGLWASIVAGMRRRGWLARPPWRRALRVAAVTVGLGAATWGVAVAAVLVPPALVRSDALAVETIDVAGHDRVAVDQILAAAGVEPGDNLLAVELPQVADDVRALPWIGDVQLRRRYPDRLCITVVEREPVLLLADQSLWFVDPDGEVFKRVEPREWIDLPVVTGLSMEDRVADPEGCRQRLREAHGVVQAFAASRSMEPEDIGELHLLPAGGFVVRTTRDGVALRLDERDVERGLARLDTLLERDLLSLAAVDQVDLSLRNQVVATRKAEL